MLTARIQSAVLTIVALFGFVGCGRRPHTYSIHTVTLQNSAGNNIVTTTFGEVVNAAACAITAKAADKGIAEGSSGGKTSDRTAVCASELPAELLKVVSGDRLPGAYIVKITWRPAPAVYTVSRGFSLGDPDAVCASLTGSVRDRLRDGSVSVTCQFPSEVSSFRDNQGVESKP